MSMKPLLMVVPLYPERHPLCQQWLEKELDTADILYLQPGPVGSDIYGSGRQLYTGGAINKEMFERIYAAWLKCKHEFFGVCFDDVVVTAPEKPLKRAIGLLEVTQIQCLGAFNREAEGGDFKNYCSRFWVTYRALLSSCTWEETMRLWEYPECEGPWLRWSGLKCSLLPGLEFNHLLSLHDEAGKDRGWRIEYYRGRNVIK